MSDLIKDRLLVAFSLITLMSASNLYLTQGELTSDVRSLLHDSVVCILALSKSKKNEKSDSKKTDKSDSKSQ